ncbi:MAG TPA: erythromycin esterase family protein [Nitrospira sp.]|nr:erythromycin esterase family protein [Nitrospira sp.]
MLWTWELKLTMIAHEAIGQGAHRLEGSDQDYDVLIDRIGKAHLVLLGEASHGTHEFYQERARITKRLVMEKGFTAVAVEADWPDAYRVHRYVSGRSRDRSAEQSLSDFKRFPTWMWRNRDVEAFVAWLRAVNDSRSEREKVGFYGLDLYSLHASMAAVLGYLDRTDAAAAARARLRYACFDHFGEDTQQYGYAAGFGLERGCEHEVIAQLTDLRRHAEEYLRRDGFVAEDAFFYAEQNARLVANAERYYRTMFTGRVASWNLRDTHMAETLDALLAHLSRRNQPQKVVVWEHNSHLGDARATQMSEAGEINVGQLVRERYGTDAVLIGFTTYQGSVTAASAWDGPTERKSVRSALPDSYEAVLHEVGIPRFLLTWDEAGVRDLFGPRRLERAIGVIYLPETERISHYFYAQLPVQFDALVHCDRTRAVEPLDASASWVDEEPPDTYPTGM